MARLVKMSAAAAVHVRVGVGCLVTHRDHKNCILLGVRQGSHGAGRLAAPGGHLEMNETWVECAAREVKEETNLALKNLRHVHTTNDASIDGNPAKHYITLFMTGEVSESSDELINLEPHKCVEWKWVPWAEVCRLARESPATLFDPMLHLVEEKRDFLPID